MRTVLFAATLAAMRTVLFRAAMRTVLFAATLAVLKAVAMPVFFAAPLLVAINGFMIGNHRIGLPHARHRI
jgi:hypothetical protein